jgi:hypothetical protein
MKLNDYCDKTVKQLEYASVIRSLIYAMHCIRPDIIFAIYKLSIHTSKPNINH